jgi:eukaryotic-like serine/threonine-protein kinase
MDFQVENGGARVVLRGRLTENSNLSSLVGKLGNPAVLDLAGVTRINSYGAREWLSFIRSIPSGTTVILERCPVAFVNQLNMIHDFAGRAVVRSVFVPYLCTRCHEPRERLVDVSTRGKGGALQPATCECGGELEPDMLEEQFFAFLTLKAG